MTKLLTESPELAEGAEAQEHFRGCPRCFELYRELRDLSELTRDLYPEQSVPPDFADRVVRRRRAEARWKPAAIGSLSLALGAAIVLGLIPSVEPDSRVLPRAEPAAQLERFPEQAGRETERNSPEEANSYVDVLMEQRHNPEYILRLPSRIEIRRTELHSDFYLNNVSH